jgi:hypothetical protein
MSTTVVARQWARDRWGSTSGRLVQQHSKQERNGQTNCFKHIIESSILINLIFLKSTKNDTKKNDTDLGDFHFSGLRLLVLSSNASRCRPFAPQPGYVLFQCCWWWLAPALLPALWTLAMRTLPQKFLPAHDFATWTGLSAFSFFRARIRSLLCKRCS